MAETRQLRATRRVTAMQSKENPVLAHKNVMTKQVGTVRATLGEISNRPLNVNHNPYNVAVLKGAGIAPPLKSSTLKVPTISKNGAQKENMPIVKPKGLAVSKTQNKNVTNISRVNITSKPPIAKPAATNILKRTASLVTNKPTSTVSVVKPKSAILKKTVTSQPKLPSLELIPPVKAKTPSPQKVVSFSTEQIQQWANLDMKDKSDAQSAADYVREIFEYLKEMEITLSIPEDYMQRSMVMTPSMRGMLMDWLVDVHRQFKLMPETLYLAVFIFDRYMSLANDTPKNQLQLVGVTCLLVAAKYEEIFCPNVSDCTYITDNTYSKKQVMEMEMKILGKLQFNVGRPVPLHFLRRYTKVSESCYADHAVAKYFLELQLVRHEMCHILPSLQAAAALCLALWVNGEENETPKSTWSPALQFFSGYSYRQVEEALKSLVTVVVKGHTSPKLMAVRKKYSNKIFMNASGLIDGVLDRIQNLFA